MALWNTTSNLIVSVNTSTPDSGYGDSVYEAFTKVNNSIEAISAFLGSPNADFVNANVEAQFNSTGYTNLNNLFVANATGTTAQFTGNISSSNTVIASNVLVQDQLTVNQQANFLGNLNVSASIIPATTLAYDLGSPTMRFRNLYVGSTISTSQIAQTTTAGLLQIHEGAPPSDSQDVGVFGNIAPNFLGINTYAFFGHQYLTNNFVYKITPTDTTKGNNVVYDGVYGGAQFGSMLLSNSTVSTNTSTGTLVTAGGAGIGGNLNVGGNTNIAGNLIAGGSYASIGGYQVLTTNTPGLTQFSNSLITQLVITGANPATSLYTGGLILPYGGASISGDLVLGGNITGIPSSTASYYFGSNGSAILASGAVTVSSSGSVVAPVFVGNLNGLISAASPAQPNITSVGTLSSLQVATTVGAGGVILSGSGLSGGAALIINSAGANITGAINATGTITATGNITAPYFIGNVVSIATGNFTGANVGTLSVTSNANIIGNLVASGNASISGNLNVAGNTNVSTLSVSSNARVSGNASISGTLNVVGNTNVNTLSVSSNANFAGTASISGTLNVVGNTSVANITVTSTASVNNLVATTLTATNGYIQTINASTVQAATIGNTGASLVGTIATAAQPNITSATGLVSVGTLTNGTWNATVISPTYGGSGVAGTLTGVLYANGTSAYSVASGTQLNTALSGLAPALVGTNFSGTAGSLVAGAATGLQYLGTTPPNTSGSLPSGASVNGVYSNGYPTAYGNLLNLAGGGYGQLLIGWSGSTGGVADNYIRSLRDTAVGTNNWSAWAKILTDQNYNSTVPSLTGTGASGTWGINITGSAGSAANATTAGGLAVATGRNNSANQIVRTDSNGYIQAGYINSSNGDENNASSPSRVWGTNGIDSYMRTYQTGSLSVGYAASAGSLAWSNLTGVPSLVYNNGGSYGINITGSAANGGVTSVNGSTGAVTLSASALSAMPVINTSGINTIGGFQVLYNTSVLPGNSSQRFFYFYVSGPGNATMNDIPPYVGIAAGGSGITNNGYVSGFCWRIS